MGVCIKRLVNFATEMTIKPTRKTFKERSVNKKFQDWKEKNQVSNTNVLLYSLKNLESHNKFVIFNALILTIVQINCEMTVKCLIEYRIK